MSTPVNQLQGKGPGPGPGSGERPPMINDAEVQDVISAMEREVSTRDPPMIKTTNVTTFEHPYQQQHQQPQQHQPQYPYNGYSGGSVNAKTNTFIGGYLDEWVDGKDAQTALIVAAIALCIFHTLDTSYLYAKFEILDRFQQYDIFIRAFLLFGILYVLLRKFT